MRTKSDKDNIQTEINELEVIRKKRVDFQEEMKKMTKTDKEDEAIKAEAKLKNKVIIRIVLLQVSSKTFSKTIWRSMMTLNTL